MTGTQQSSQGTVLRSTSATYTPAGKVATATDANGNVTGYAYDLLDRQTSVTDAMGRVTLSAYDAQSRPTATYNKAIQAGPLLQQAYTPNGLRASLTDANGHPTGFAYDGFDRLATTTYIDSSTETLAYDADSNVTSRVTRAGTTLLYGYDTLNRLITKTAAAAPVACTATPSSTPTVTYGYDPAGRLTGVCDNGAAIASIATPASSTFYTASYSYDAVNRPTGVTYGDVPAATPVPLVPITFSHGYNAVNQRVSQTVSDNSWISYPSGPTATTGYTANSLNQYTCVGVTAPSCAGVVPTYDGNGNLTSDGTYTLGYDAENRLTSATASGLTAAYAYDARGRRKAKTVNGTTTVFVTDADNREVLEYDGSSGAILRWYAYGLGSNDVLAQTTPGGTPARVTFIRNLEGSIVGSVSTTGALTSFAYKPYGGSASPPSQFAYTGQRIDPETGYYYYRARHYSPSWGRFPQTDPRGHKGGILLYAYVSNDPLNLIDPMGLASESFWARTSSAYRDFAQGTEVYGAGIERQQIAELEYAGDHPVTYAAGQLAPFAAVAGMAAPALLGAATAGGGAAFLEAPAAGTVAAWSGPITAGTVPEGGMLAFRVWGGGSAEAGSWLSPIAPSSSAAARSLLALPEANAATFVSRVAIPAGTPIQFGTAASAFGNAGGGIQIQLLSRIPLSSFGPAVALPP